MSDDNKHDLSITRVLDAPIDRVWRAWTDPVELQKWWGPRGVTNPVCIWDAKPGGKIEITMLAGEGLGNLAGQEWPMVGEVKEVSPKEKLVFSSSPIMDGKPIMDSLCTVSFEDLGEKTKMTLSIVVTRKTADAEGPLKGMEMGWNQSLDKLAEQLI